MFTLIYDYIRSRYRATHPGLTLNLTHIYIYIYVADKESRTSKRRLTVLVKGNSFMSIYPYISIYLSLHIYIYICTQPASTVCQRGEGCVCMP